VSTWTAVIVDTQGRKDFWDAVHAEGVEPMASRAVPALALISVESGADFEAPLKLAESLSTVLPTTAIGFAAQTTSDAYEIRAYDRGECARRVAYSRDDGGWLAVEGIPQPWEPVFFFDGAAPSAADAPGGHWPDTIDDDLSEFDVARYEAARRARDPSRVMDLLRLHSTAPLLRLCAFYGIAPDAPVATWSKPSLWSKLFG
jgi:hypothetical protein